MAEEETSTKPPPIHAWMEKQRSSDTSEEDSQRPLMKILSSSLCLWEGAESMDMEREALDYVCSFIQKNGQDITERLKFLDQLDVICNATSIDGFFFYTSGLLLEVVKILIHWTVSSVVQMREKATKKIAEICHGIQSHKEVSNFPVIGQLVGCLTLCCFDSSEEVTGWATEGLHYLCTFILHRSGQDTEDKEESKELLQMEWEQEDTQWATWASDPVHIITFFKKYLSPDELTDLLVAAIGGMEDSSIHSTQAAVCIVKAILKDPMLTLGQVPSLVTFIHSSIDSINDTLAQQEVLRTLTIMGKSYMSEVANTLLSCSPECDSAALTMWNILVCFSDLAEEVLTHLQACLQGQPLWPDVSAEKATFLRFAATNVLQELLREPLPSFTEEIKDRWEKLCLALIFWISHMFYQKVWAWKSITSYLQDNVAEAASLSLARSATNTLRSLLRNADCGNEDLLTKKLVLWELLSREEGFHQGVSLFTRAIVKSRPQELKWMVEHVMAILDGSDEGDQITAMVLFAELLQSPDIGTVRDKGLLHHLSRQLVAPKAILRSLALDGLIHLASNPDQVKKLLLLLPEILKRLQEPDREMTLKALRLVKLLIGHLEGQRNPSLTLEVVGQVLPLFDDESHKVRSLAICIFGNILEIATRQNKTKLKEYALQSLVPLLMHLHDRSPIVIAACWDTLSEVTTVLKFRKLQPLILNRHKWSICVVITKNYRKVPECHFLSQCTKHLKNPQTSIREVAIRLIGLAAQETKSKRKLEVICRALNELQNDPKPSVSCLAIQTMKILEAVHDQIPSGCSLRALLHQICRRTCFQ